VRRCGRTAGSRPLLRLFGLASITVSFLAASSAPTPLYATYQAAWGFSALTTTVVFGVYAIAFLAALLMAGRLSDHIGRRPALLAGIAGQLIALAVFVNAHSVAALLAARIVQGLVLQMFGVALVPETSPRAPGAWRSLIPQLALPVQTRRPLLAAAPVLFAVWALAGFYGSLGPALIDHLVGSTSVVDGGLGLGILAGVASLTTYLLRALLAPNVMLIGTSALIAGVAAVLLSLWTASSLGFFAATALAGVGFGAGFQGGIRLVAPLAHPDQRAGVLSVLYTASYLGLGIPAVAAGFAVAKGGGLDATSYEYGGAVIVLALFATVNLIRLRTPTQRSRSRPPLNLLPDPRSQPCP
jgi:predicted MFS family arabinose efflux permease